MYIASRHWLLYKYSPQKLAPLQSSPLILSFLLKLTLQNCQNWKQHSSYKYMIRDTASLCRKAWGRLACLCSCTCAHAKKALKNILDVEEVHKIWTIKAVNFYSSRSLKILGFFQFVVHVKDRFAVWVFWDYGYHVRVWRIQTLIQVGVLVVDSFLLPWKNLHKGNCVLRQNHMIKNGKKWILQDTTLVSNMVYTFGFEFVLSMISHFSCLSWLVVAWDHYVDFMITVHSQK